MSDTHQPDPPIKKETSDTPEVPEVKDKEDKVKKDKEDKEKKDKEDKAKKDKEDKAKKDKEDKEKKDKEDKEKKDKEDKEKKDKEDKAKKDKEDKEKRKNENGGAGEQSDDDSESRKKKRKDTHDPGQDVDMDDVIQPLSEDEDSSSEKGGSSENSDTDEEGKGDDSDSDGDSTLTDYSDGDFEDVRKDYPKDDDPEYRALEMKRRNYDLINVIDRESGSTDMFIHKIRGHCATLGFVKKYGSAHTLYLNQYGGIDIKKKSNRTWWRLESQAEDEEYETLAENDEEFQRVNSLQLEDRHASTKRFRHTLKHRFKKSDAKLSGAAWETNWDLIPWHKFEWKKLRLKSFEDARARHDENKLSRDQLAAILHFQIMHEINQIDPDCQDHQEGMMIYVRTLWKSRQYPVSWEPQSNTKRVYGNSQPDKITKRSNTNGDRYVEGVQDPSILQERESSVEMDAKGNETYADSRGNKTKHKSETMDKKYKLEPMSRRSRSPEGSDPEEDATEFDSGSEDGRGRSKSENKKMMKMIKELGFQLSTVALNTAANGSRVAALEESLNGKKKGRRPRR